MTTRVPLCIYHGSCDDGFGAALAVHLALDGQVELFHGAYTQPPPSEAMLRDRDVVLVDFSYKRAVLDQMREHCRSMLVLDHHKTAQEDLAHLPPPEPTWEEHVGVSLSRLSPVERMCPAAALFDMERSGSMIAWQFFHPRENPPLFFEYLQDRDLWRQKLEDGAEFTMALRSYPQEIDVWRRLMWNTKGLIDEGVPITRYYRRKIDEMATTAVIRTLGGHAVPVCNAPYFAASELAGDLSLNHPFAAAYFYNGREWQFSLRSRGDFDVGAFARDHFGGGGHKQAAGFGVARLPWENT